MSDEIHRVKDSIVSHFKELAMKPLKSTLLYRIDSGRITEPYNITIVRDKYSPDYGEYRVQWDAGNASFLLFTDLKKFMKGFFKINLDEHSRLNLAVPSPS